MPSTTVSGSSNIAVFDLKVIASLCTGQFCLDVTPSTYIGSGKNNLLGVKFKIDDQYGVPVRPYPVSSYDLSPALSADMDSSVCFNIPTLAGTYKYGTYTVTAELTDADGSKYYVTKKVTICPPNSKDKSKNYGTLSAKIFGSCKDGKLFVIADTVPAYNGKISETQVSDFELRYPTISGLDPIETNQGSFSVQLFEGEYMFSGEICATYNFTDNIYVEVKYKIKKTQNVRCLIDECCVFERLEELNARLKTNCTEAERTATTEIILETLNYLKQIELAAQCGKDATEYIESMEKLLGCTCTCNCAEGTPIINNNPSKDFLIEGCGVSKQTVGLTDVYTIDNFEYVVGVIDNGGILVVSTAVQTDCTKTQNITFNISAAYTQIKGLANADNTEAAFWASVINKVLTLVDGSCIDTGWAGMTFQARIAAIIAKVCACCGCAATIDSSSVQKVGSGVKLSWTDTGEFAVDVYLDGVFKGRVLSTVDEFTFDNAADGSTHSWVLVPVCSNNKFGIAASGEFTELGCPSITPPVVSSNNVNAECPYDLSTLLSAPPVGITYEWHTQNNTNSSSLLANPSSVSSGVYYVFAKDSNGCYSTATQVTLVCIEETSCTAPQNLSVSAIGGGFLVQFQSAAFAPPSNSYTVKRRLKSDPDLDGSYTTIGSPSFNGSSNKWEILDSSASNNTLYVYKAISNCGGSPPSTPYTTYEFANITCPSVTITPSETALGTSFTHVGGGVDKYKIELYDSTGTMLLATNLHTPAFATPVTGTFSGLTASTSYKIKTTVYIGTYSKVCTTQSTATSGASGDKIYWFLNGVVGAKLTIKDSASPPATLLDELSTSTPKSGTLSGLTGPIEICGKWNSGSGNIIKMRICDSNGNELFYSGNINVGDPEDCYTTVSLPASGAPYYVFVTAGDVEPNTCGV